MKEKEYVTERGVTIGIRAIPLLLDEIRKANPPPKAPTYTETLAGGATREHTITDEEAVAWAETNPESWAEHADDWLAYQAKLDAWSTAVDARVLDAVALEAVRVPLPESDAWVRRHQVINGMEVPEDPDLRRIHYVKTEVLGGPRDILQVTVVAGGADLDEEALAIAEDSFRHSLQASLTAGLAAQAGAMAHVDEDGGAADGAGVGADAG